MMIVVCYLVLSRVPFIHDFDSMTLLFSNHTFVTGVPENNRVTLSKSQIEGTRDINQMIAHNDRYSQTAQNTLDHSETTHLTS
jgi:hypothetical protein